MSINRFRKHFLLVLALWVAAAALPAPGTGQSSDAPVPTLQPAFFTPRDTADNVDSPAVWHGPDGQHWLIATTKEGDVLQVHDATNGSTIRRIGEEGGDLGQFDRPNGIAVIDDLVLVVERNNARVQVLQLPDFRSLGTLGAELLRRPYGLNVLPDGEEYRLYVTDQYELPGERIPPDSLLGERVHQFRLRIDSNAVQSKHVRAFGATSGPGVLHVVESIGADPAHDRLLIAEEEDADSKLMVYTFAGAFTGETIPSTFFPHEAEGIALYACDGGTGYWIATDQDEAANTFHVFDRASLAHVGAFRIDGVLNTDGIALTQAALGPFAHGALYAVHDDGNVAAVDWDTIAERLQLTTRCTP